MTYRSKAYREFAARILSDTYKDAKKVSKRRKKTVKACRSAVKTAMDIKHFVNSDWADTLCATANVDPEAFQGNRRTGVKQILDSFRLSFSQETLALDRRQRIV